MSKRKAPSLNVDTLAFGIDRDVGTLEPGKLADMAFIDGNPLERIEDSINVKMKQWWWHSAEYVQEFKSMIHGAGH